MPRPFNALYTQTLAHLRHHDCGTYPFRDGESLITRVAELQPRRILELGTALGYTACCFASAAPQALIDTCEMDQSHVALARENLARHDFASRVTVHHGKFENMLPHFGTGYDLAFFDGFAPDLQVLTEIFKRIRVGGVLMCANLGLSEPMARKHIEIEIQSLSHWKIQPPLENGGTLVAEKCVA